MPPDIPQPAQCRTTGPIHQRSALNSNKKQTRLCNKNERNTMEESQNLFARWHRRLHTVWSHLCETSCKGNSIDTERSSVAVSAVGENELTANGPEGSYWDNKDVLNLDRVMAAQLGRCTKNHWIAYCRWVNLWYVNLTSIKPVFFLNEKIGG